MGFRPAEVDVGTHVWGTVVPLCFTLWNDGPTALEIAAVETSCGCTAVTAVDQLVGTVVEPGHSVAIEAQWDLQSAPGPKGATITIRCASGEKFRAHAVAKVRGTWEISPESLNFGEIALDGAHQEPVEEMFSFTSDADSLVGEPEPDASWLRCVTAKRGPAQTEVLVVVVTDRLPPGRQEALIRLRTTSPIAPSGLVRVSAVGRQDLVCTPSQLFLQGDEARVVRVTDVGGGACELVVMESSNPAVLATLQQGGKLSIRNTAGQPLTESVTVRIKDDRGRRGRILVSTF